MNIPLVKIICLIVGVAAIVISKRSHSDDYVDFAKVERCQKLKRSLETAEAEKYWSSVLLPQPGVSSRESADDFNRHYNDASHVVDILRTEYDFSCQGL